MNIDKLRKFSYHTIDELFTEWRTLNAKQKLFKRNEPMTSNTSKFHREAREAKLSLVCLNKLYAKLNKANKHMLVW